MKTPTTMVAAQNVSVQQALNATAQPVGGPAVFVPRSVPAGTSPVEFRVHGVDIGGLLADNTANWSLRRGTTVIPVNAEGLAPDQVNAVFIPDGPKGLYSLRVLRGGLRWVLRDALEVV